LGDVRNSGRDRGARIPAAQRLPVDPDGALGWHPDAGDRLGELALAVAGNAGDRDDLARADDERGAFDGRVTAIALRPHALELEHGLTGRPSSGLAGTAELAPDHERRERPR